jgi:phosphomethylpyrimidine synthase
VAQLKSPGGKISKEISIRRPRSGTGISGRPSLKDGRYPANVRYYNLVPGGNGLFTKVNASIGTSSDSATSPPSWKGRGGRKASADTIMASTGGDIASIRRAIIAACPRPIGTVPIYQAGVEAIQKYGAIVNMTADGIFQAIEDNARDGVDFVTVHCGINRASIAQLKKQGRITDVVSRGGAFTVGWMLHNDLENPLYEQYDRLLNRAGVRHLSLMTAWLAACRCHRRTQIQEF